MTITLLLTPGLKAATLALTPLERLKATGSRLGANFETDFWFILSALLAVILLIVVFLVVNYSRRTQQRGAGNGLFTEYARKIGLSRYESKILLQMAQKAGLKQSEAIFTMADVFDRGADEIMQGILSKLSIEESERLKTDLSFLREKLGFQKKYGSAIGPKERPRRLSSRQIPVGKKLHITRRKARNLSDIESTVVRNDDAGLMVRMAVQVESSPGESWRAHYYFGASVWEFDTSVVSCGGDILVLNHSDEVRFINRRRFLRVPVNRPAFVARFPFARMLQSVSSLEDRKLNDGKKTSSWGPPEFVPAVVTELAGPGLRIELPLEVKTGDRVLVVFELDGKSSRSSDLQKTNGTTPARIVEDVGEVRHVKTIEKGFSIAVELTGLGDSDIDELIRATNAAALMARAQGQGVSNTSGNRPEEAPAEQLVPELTAESLV